MRFFLFLLCFCVKGVGAVNIKSSVEAVFFHDDQVLLVKRADNCKIAPGVWNVPAGKVKEGEALEDAVVREMEEETQVKTRVVRLLGDNTFNLSDGTPRRMFTYLVESDQFSSVVLDREHSAYAWVTEEQLKNDTTYSSLMPRLKDIILQCMESR